jgi:hypothetical protein
MELITGYTDRVTRKNERCCFNTNRELFFVDASLMLSLPFYIEVEQVYYDKLDANGEHTGEKFYRNEATSSTKGEYELESL